MEGALSGEIQVSLAPNILARLRLFKIKMRTSGTATDLRSWLWEEEGQIGGGTVLSRNLHQRVGGRTARWDRSKLHPFFLLATDIL